MRVLYVPRFGERVVDAPIAQSMDDAAKNLIGLGHEVEVGKVPFDTDRFERSMNILGASGLAWLLRDADWRGQIGDEYIKTIEDGQRFSAIEYYEALEADRELFRELADAFQAYDFTLTPSAGAMPWAADSFNPPHHAPFTAFANLTGVPAISIPAKPGPTGVPIGFQLFS
ncbi:hypothetical protein IG197_16765 [Aminobacter sp. SR38]|jgi:aspartyl-tRNA(Asn)/glutamyl-tRNA(Gln) amidotransferase subunit A|uniref:amidase family protein n=1 Tax=Aminobacter sp. SR38 TaxID=2774562 RepID=UPI00177E67DF|nr:amidase family protein [Aminobacter sp. SR38]QOF69515.1 hypothetical protein IG197_16765 [Aminobacter sp. SR38]